MSGRIPEETLQAIRDAVDIVDLISTRIDLTPRGRNFLGLCPFHNEKTPSFTVHPESGIFKCYGCGKGGNAYHFLMEMDQLSFPEAVKELGRVAGIAVDSGPAGPGDDLQRLRRVVSWAGERFAEALWSPSGEGALRYLTDRGFTEETLRRFEVGYAPDDWHWLERQAENGAMIDAMVTVGLLKRKEPARIYDAFRDRVMFPIHDRSGRAIAFGGRVMPGADKDAPKYINSPESLLYKKSHALFGYRAGRDAIRKAKHIVVVEGYTDVMMAHQCGFEQVVACCGTALTAEHASLLARVATEDVVFLFDGDTAGLAASERSLELMLPHERKVRVVGLPGGADPHEFLTNHGAEAFAEALSKGQGFFRFKLEQLGQRHDLGDPHGKARAADELLAVLAKVPNPNLRDTLTGDLAQELGISAKAMFERRHQRHNPAARRDTAPEPERVQSSGPPRESVLLAILTHRPSLVATVAARYPLGKYRHEGVRRVAQKLYEVLGEDVQADLGGVLSHFHDPVDCRLLIDAHERITRPEDLDGYLAEFLGRDELRDRSTRAKELKAALERAEEAQDRQMIDRITKEYVALMGGKTRN